MSSKTLDNMCYVLWSDTIRLALSRRMLIVLINFTPFLKKIKGDFRGYGMGMRYTYYLKGINTLQIIVFSVKDLQRLQPVMAGILFNVRRYCSSNNKAPLLHMRNWVLVLKLILNRNVSRVERKFIFFIFLYPLMRGNRGVKYKLT